MARNERPVAIVTGASQGIGEAIARKLAAGGWHIALLARRQAVLDVVVEDIRNKDGSAEPAVVDVTDFARFAETVAAIAARHGRLDGFVNNAFFHAAGTILDQPVATWLRHFEMNCGATFAGVQAAMTVMCPQGSGAIVNIGSISGVRAASGSSGYGASKAGLFHLGAIAAVEAGAYGVRVNTVTPGGTWSPSFTAAMAKLPPERVAEQEHTASALGRFGQPGEVADAVAFLLSDEARFITGVNLPVEGGAQWFRAALPVARPR